MRSTIISVVLTLLILAGGFGLFSILKSQKEPAPRIPPTSRIKQVRYQRVENQDLPIRIRITGPLTARDRIELFSEVGGIYLKGEKSFREGVYFKEGETMVRIDDREYTLGVKAAKSALMNQITVLLPDLKTDYPESFPQWQAYLREMSMDEPLPELPEPQSEQERYFISARNLYNQYYNIRSQEARADKYRIEAPFSGKVSSSLINEGTLVRVGQKLGEFVNPYVYEMEAAVSLKDLSYVRPGSTVSLEATDMQGKWTGRVIRISDVIDPNTQTAKLFVSVSGRDLREGMYLEGTIEGSSLAEVSEIDRSLMIDDSSLYVVVDVEESPLANQAASSSDSTQATAPTVIQGKLQAHQVEAVQYTQNTVFVRGLPEGAYLVNEPLSDAYEGLPVALYQNRGQQQ